MIIGPIVNGTAVIMGGVAGAYLGTRMPERLRIALPLTFGLASIGMGVSMVVKLKFLPAVILALIVGAIIGELLYLEQGIGKFGSFTKKLFEKNSDCQYMETDQKDSRGLTHTEFLEKFVAIIVLFSASATGIFGAMNEGMTGDPSILYTKSILDFFTGAIFATALGYSVAVVAIPLLIVQVSLALGATFIYPLTNEFMIADFSGVGGMVMLATGLRICGIKSFPVANMIPCLFFAMPISALWVKYVVGL